MNSSDYLYADTVSVPNLVFLTHNSFCGICLRFVNAPVYFGTFPYLCLILC